MTRVLVGIAALGVFILCARKSGVKNALAWGSYIVLALPSFTMTGLFLPWVCRSLGIPRPSNEALFEGAVAFAAGAVVTAHVIGWAKVLRALFVGGVMFAYVFLLGLILFLVLAMANGAH